MQGREEIPFLLCETSGISSLFVSVLERADEPEESGAEEEKRACSGAEATGSRLSGQISSSRATAVPASWCPSFAPKTGNRLSHETLSGSTHDGHNRYTFSWTPNHANAAAGKRVATRGRNPNPRLTQPNTAHNRT